MNPGDLCELIRVHSERGLITAVTLGKLMNGQTRAWMSSGDDVTEGLLVSIDSDWVTLLLMRGRGLITLNLSETDRAVGHHLELAPMGTSEAVKIMMQAW